MINPAVKLLDQLQLDDPLARRLIGVTLDTFHCATLRELATTEPDAFNDLVADCETMIRQLGDSDGYF